MMTAIRLIRSNGHDCLENVLHKARGNVFAANPVILSNNLHRRLNHFRRKLDRHFLRAIFYLNVAHKETTSPMAAFTSIPTIR
jgi:hypothetical protein